MDTAREYIAEVMTRLDDVTGGQNKYKVGGLTWAEHDEPPIIKWRYGDIAHEPPEKNGDIYSEVQDLEVRIWAVGNDQDESETNTRELKNALLIAAREASQGRFLGLLTVGTFRWGEEAHGKLGRYLDGTLSIHLPVPNRTLKLVKVTAVEAPGYLQSTTDPDQETLGCTVELPDT